MFCPRCRTSLERGDPLYCAKCDVSYHSPIDVGGKPIDKVGCLDEANNVFYAKIGDSTLIVKQPRIDDLPRIREGLKLASEYTYMRFPSWLWKHTQGVCYLRLHKRGAVGTLSLIMILDGEVVGFGQHNYWHLTEAVAENEDFPTPVGALCTNVDLCVFDTYQRQGIGTICSKVSEYIAKHNEASLIMGGTFKEGGMLNIWLKDGWMNFGERAAGDGGLRILLGKPLS